MDPDPGAAAAAAGSFIPLTEPEQRLYSALRSRCQAESSGGGKLSSSKVAELLKASQLPPEALHRVTEVCGAKRLGYFATPQFYVALKLLAAAQSGLPVRLESVTATNLPLPRFPGLKNEAELRFPCAPPPCADPQQGAAAPAAWAAVDRGALRHLEAPPDKKEPWSPPGSPSSSPPRSPLTYRSYGYNPQKNGADTHIVAENKPPLRPNVQPEQHCSPAHYGTKPGGGEFQAMARSSSAERLAQQGAADPSADDPWRITEEQLDYYTNQFKGLQPDLGALILGTVAKNFFTKSKLPIPELSHIWELSDVDRDGALTFSEFCTAFHLIVARKNGYPLPERLPPPLRPGATQQDPDPDTPESVEPLIVFEEAEPRPSHMDRNILGTTKPDLKDESCKQDGSLQRVTERKRTLQLGTFTDRPEPPHDLDPQMRTRTRPRSYSSTSIEDAAKKGEEPPTPPPRPQKSHSRASSLDLNKLFQQGASGVKSGWLPPPPALPPRPPASQVPLFIGASEKLPSNKVPQPNFADFSRFREEESSGARTEEPGLQTRFGPSTDHQANTAKPDVGPSLAPQKPLRRKFHPENPSAEAAAAAAAAVPAASSFPPQAKPAQRLLSKQKREIQLAIRKNKETNAVLTRLNSELQQQLKVVHKERVTLESQLELLRPVAST